MSAGRGERLRPFTLKTPKPLLPLMGIPMLQYQLDYLKYYNFNRVVINLHHLRKKAHEQILKELDFQNLKISISLEETLLGSGGGIRQAMDFITVDDFLILNSDSLLDFSLKDFSEVHFKMKNKNDTLITLALKKKDRHSYSNVKVDEKTKSVVGIRTKEKTPYFYTGAAIVDSRAIKSFSRGTVFDLIESVVLPAITEKKVTFFDVAESSYIDIGDPALWAAAHFELMKAIETKNLFSPWQQRVLDKNSSEKPMQWSLKSIEKNGDKIKMKEPCYLASSKRKSDSEFFLGPNVVCYDDLGDKNLNFISFDGDRVLL